MEPQPSSQRYAIGPLLRRAHRRATDAFNKGLVPLGIEGRHFGLLAVLEQAGPMSQTQLAARSHHDKSAIVRMVDDLQALGYLERRPDAHDRRAFAVTLTAQGRAAFHEAEAVGERVANGLLAGFTDHDRSELERLLTAFASGQAVASTRP